MDPGPTVSTHNIESRSLSRPFAYPFGLLDHSLVVDCFSFNFPFLPTREVGARPELVGMTFSKSMVEKWVDDDAAACDWTPTDMASRTNRPTS